MGNSQGVNKNEEFSIKNFQPVKTIADPFFGEGRIVEDKKTKDKYLLVQKMEREIKKNHILQSIIHDSIAIVHPHILQIAGLSSAEKSEFCSKYYCNYIFLDCPPYTLQYEIEQRKIKSLHFSENELFGLLESVSSALAMLQRNGIKHQSLSTQTIYIDERSNYKIAIPESMYVTNLFEEVCYAPKNSDYYYLCPEYVKVIQKVNKLVFEE